MRKNRPLYYVIPRETLNQLGVPATLDMLRYDGSTVECNAPDGHYLFRDDSGRGPHIERWCSFSVRIEPWQIAGEIYELIDACRARAKPPVAPLNNKTE